MTVTFGRRILKSLLNRPGHSSYSILDRIYRQISTFYFVPCVYPELLPGGKTAKVPKKTFYLFPSLSIKPLSREASKKNLFSSAIIHLPKGLVNYSNELTMQLIPVVAIQKPLIKRTKTLLTTNLYIYILPALQGRYPPQTEFLLSVLNTTLCPDITRELFYLYSITTMRKPTQERVF